MKVRFQTRHKIALVFLMPVLAFLCVSSLPGLYESLKFSYLIRRVESAKTAAEEREAFILAQRWGQVWSVILREPPKNRLEFDYKELDAAVSDPQRTLVLELVWLEHAPNEPPYRAYRTLTDKSNIYVLLPRRW